MEMKLKTEIETKKSDERDVFEGTLKMEEKYLRDINY